MRTLTNVLVAVTLAACSSAPAASPSAPATVTRSAAARELDPRIATAEQEAFVAGQAAFAGDAFQAIAKDKDHEDFFFSPHGISTAFAMLYAGARGETASEMQRVLHYDLPADRLHAAFDATNLVLDRREDLHVADAVFAQDGYPFELPYLDTLATWYGAEPRAVDFSGDTERARATVNAWANEQTKGRIPEVLGPRALQAETRMVLANAVYLDAKWETPFVKASTARGTFSGLDGEATTVQMMRGTEQLGRYLRGDGYEAVALPYRGRTLELLLVVPDAGKFRDVRGRLTGVELAALPERLEDERLVVSMPKLTLTSELSLRPVLASLGMTRVFDSGSADLGGISRREGLRVSDAKHVAWVSIDEEGTEAAAVTAIVVGGATGGVGARHVEVNRPFIAAVVERQTRAILFLGQVVAPAAR